MLVFTRNDPRTPLEKSVGVNPDTCRDRTLTEEQKNYEKRRDRVIQFLASKNIVAIPRQDGGLTLMPEYPEGSSSLERELLDRRCEAWIRQCR